MAIRVDKVADIIGGQVAFSSSKKGATGDIVAVLTNLTEVDHPTQEHGWRVDLIIADRRMTIDLPRFLSRTHPADTPIFLTDELPNARAALIYFRDRLFWAERQPLRASERDEIILRVKKAIYDEETELSSLRAAVANLEAAAQFQKSDPKRDPIPEDVKLVVWARDGGRCVRCGSQQELHFDHIIPVVKGGGNSEANIQILCQPCNLKKSDKIAFT